MQQTFHVEDDKNDRDVIFNPEGEGRLHDKVTFDLDAQGHLFGKSQFTDYVYRGDELSGLNVVEYFTNTYKSVRRADDHARMKAGIS